jgi:hypothetical protein
MTESEKTAIDACKDQAAQKEGFENWLKAQDEYYTERDVTSLEHTMDRAMQLYGEQCRKDSEKASAYTINRTGSIVVVISKTGKGPRLLLQALVLYKNIDFVSFEENEDAGTLAALFLPRDNDVAQRIVEYINTANLTAQA